MAADEVIRPDGRWGGRLTRRDLPMVGEGAIGAAALATRERVAEVWLARAASERRVADSFVVVRAALIALGADAALIALADRAIDDEMRHAEISRIVASRYAGRELAHPPRLALAVPRHDGVSASARHVLHVVGQCAINETIASVYLENALAFATAPLARVALRELLADEIDHARIGWAVAGAASPDARRALGVELPRMCVANLRMWRAPRGVPEGPELAAHGAPPPESVERGLLVAFRELVVPGFASIGVETAPIACWLDAGAAT